MLNRQHDVANEIVNVQPLLGSSAPASGESVTPLSLSPHAAVSPAPASVDGWTLTPPCGSTSLHKEVSLYDYRNNQELDCTFWQGGLQVRPVKLTP